MNLRTAEQKLFEIWSKVLLSQLDMTDWAQFSPDSCVFIHSCCAAVKSQIQIIPPTEHLAEMAAQKNCWHQLMDGHRQKAPLQLMMQKDRLIIMDSQKKSFSDHSWTGVRIIWDRQSVRLTSLRLRCLVGFSVMTHYVPLGQSLLTIYWWSIAN